MKFDKLTLKAQEALATAQQFAMARSNTILSPLHLLAALLSDEQGIVTMIISKIGGNPGRIKDMTDGECRRLPVGRGEGMQILPDPSFNNVVLDAQNRADAMGDEYLSVEHLLMSLA
ncbi:MAG TPA: Clp protease N-terminal domain-containing protein, partial [Sedimentisphaerales bacterium]|nr:Clp protease N-terminal domain-containing protein [Sedimentisphaerales bacterium]